MTTNEKTKRKTSSQIDDAVMATLKEFPKGLASTDLALFAEIGHGSRQRACERLLAAGKIRRTEYLWTRTDMPEPALPDRKQYVPYWKFMKGLTRRLAEAGKVMRHVNCTFWLVHPDGKVDTIADVLTYARELGVLGQDENVIAPRGAAYIHKDYLAAYLAPLSPKESGSPWKRALGVVGVGTATSVNVAS